MRFTASWGFLPYGHFSCWCWHHEVFWGDREFATVRFCGSAAVQAYLDNGLVYKKGPDTMSRMEAQLAVWQFVRAVRWFIIHTGSLAPDRAERAGSAWRPWRDRIATVAMMNVRGKVDASRRKKSGSPQRRIHQLSITSFDNFLLYRPSLAATQSTS